MQRWSGRVAVVTGASVGIGRAIVEQLVKDGLKVVGVARRVENINELAGKLKSAPGKLYGVKADLAREADIYAAVKWVKDNLGGIDILINNAGIAINEKFFEAKPDNWRQILNVNLVGLSIFSQEAVKSMKERGVDDGHIIHINSVAGQHLLQFEGVQMYSASKHAVRVLAEGQRLELAQMKSHIRITDISPGLVDTDMVRKNLPAEMLKAMPSLNPEDIAGAVVYTLSTPPHVQVHEITIRPVGETY